ncbi:MAG: hypothetical protein U1F87_07670 [Kiritimatiellia bacterium]
MITLILNREERKLVMDYGYPFEEIAVVLGRGVFPGRQRRGHSDP